VAQREAMELWKALHDLVMLVLADYDVDFDEMAHLNAGQELDQALADPEAHRTTRHTQRVIESLVQREC
jgi:hypothetical protein